MVSTDRPSRLAPWLVYTGLRLLCFGVPLGVVYGLSGNLLLSAIIAAIVGVCLSVILLERWRHAVTEPMAARQSTVRRDEDIEDEAVDGQNASAAANPKP